MVDPGPWPPPQFPRHSLFLLTLLTLCCGPGPPWELGVSSNGKVKSCRSTHVSEVPGGRDSEGQRGGLHMWIPGGRSFGLHLKHYQLDSQKTGCVLNVQCDKPLLCPVAAGLLLASPWVWEKQQRCPVGWRGWTFLRDLRSQRTGGPGCWEVAE